MASKVLIKIKNSSFPFGNAWTLVRAGLFSRFKLFVSRKVNFKNEGTMEITNGRLFLGFLSNEVGMDLRASGVFRVYKGGEFRSHGLVRFAQTCKVYVAGVLSIGAGTYINPNTLILARKKIEIGEHCAISWDCQILDDDLHALNGNPETASAILIGNRVLIGSKAIILKGVTIGDGAVIASGAVVTRDVPANSLAAGSPARVIKHNVYWE